ncbi:MAG: aminomethyl-transferring glycine dehydrogenase subunit GcvPA [Candidatus Methanosuratincola petrocarbonis]
MITEGHRYIPNASSDLPEMLRLAGVPSLDALFSDVPCLSGFVVASSEPMDEQSVKECLGKILSKNMVYGKRCFIGGGPWFHYVPSTLKHLISRGEFLTSYTPYQPEASQGMLQALFEYQSLICELYGMEIANASLYDLSTAIAEAMLLSARVTGRRKFLVPSSLPRERVSVLRNYGEYQGVRIIEIQYDRGGGLDREALLKEVDPETAAVYVENPSFFGTIDSAIKDVVEIAHDAGALAVVGADPLSLGILKPPGEYGADIAVGDGQPLGIPPGLGGNGLGIMACRMENRILRQMPGRIVGMTRTASGGGKGYVLALSTREQHIRRGKATSNICTNESLLAVAAAIYLSLAGRDGLRRLADGILRRTDYAVRRMKEAGLMLPFSGRHFRDFAVEAGDPEMVNVRMRSRGLSGGRDLGRDFPGLRALLFAVTELHSKEDIDELASVTEWAANG